MGRKKFIHTSEFQILAGRVARSHDVFSKYIPQGRVWGQIFIISRKNLFILHKYMHEILNERTGKICGGVTASMQSRREVGVLKLAQNRAAGAHFSLGVIK